MYTPCPVCRIVNLVDDPLTDDEDVQDAKAMLVDLLDDLLGWSELDDAIIPCALALANALRVEEPDDGNGDCDDGGQGGAPCQP